LRPTISSVLALALAGCTFGFVGGGLPPTIRTVAVTPFENNTADPSLAQLVTLAVKQAVESRLGLRAAAQSQADAVVTGRITRYDPDQPLAYRGNQTSPGTANQVDVTRRQVELTVDITVVEQRTGHTLWDGKNQVVQGDYDPGHEDEGKRKALALLVNKVIDGVHQNW
jgi:Lipopolysaccharide-assembly